MRINAHLRCTWEKGSRQDPPSAVPPPTIISDFAAIFFPPHVCAEECPETSYSKSSKFYITKLLANTRSLHNANVAIIVRIASGAHGSAVDFDLCHIVVGHNRTHNISGMDFDLCNALGITHMCMNELGGDSLKSMVWLRPQNVQLPRLPSSFWKSVGAEATW